MLGSIKPGKFWPVENELSKDYQVSGWLRNSSPKECHQTEHCDVLHVLHSHIRTFLVKPSTK